MMITYMAPFPRGTRVSQPYGANKGQGPNPPGGHTGKDYAVEIGTPVHAASDGIVRNSSWLTDNYMANPWWLTRMGGDILVLDATDPFIRSEFLPTFIYAHLLDSIAQVGAHVRKGQIIATSGNSGTATTGPHCHVEVMPPNWDWNNGTYGRVNPDLYFTEYPDDVAVTSKPQTKPAPRPKPSVAKDDDMPTPLSLGPIHRKPGSTILGKGKSWYLKDKTGKTNLNVAAGGSGILYDVDLFIQGTGLPADERIEVQFILAKGPLRTGYYTQDAARGSKDGKFHGNARFNRVVPKGCHVEVSIKSTITGPDLTVYGADGKYWK